jgi:hypothetical protein
MSLITSSFSAQIATSTDITARGSSRATSYASTKRDSASRMRSSGASYSTLRRFGLK